MLFMLFLVTSGIALAIGFVLGRIWEIRLGIERQTASDSAHLPSTPSDRHTALADRLATPRDLLASQNKSQMGF
jgi:Na+/H+-dicarboxylate symporter